MCTPASTQNGRSRNHFWKLYQNNQEKLGYTTQAFVGIFLDKATHHPGAVAMLEEIPEVASCYYTTGDWSLLIQLNCKDNNHLSRLLSGKIQNIKGVLRTETYICLKQLINRQIPTD
ncbi:MAG: Lrp/AsnC ligand binding domain-containing protein [Bacteroidota bacterium]|nr:Lrp/AsnC ligand binding domain-containing protein [Bacteroidota bacterium]